MDQRIFWLAMFMLVAPVLILGVAYYRRDGRPILRYLFAAFLVVLGLNHLVLRWSISLVPDLRDQLGPFLTQYYLKWYFVPYFILIIALVLVLARPRRKE